MPPFTDSLLADLHFGVRGVRLSLPALRELEDGPGYAGLVDEATSIQWAFSFGVGHVLDLSEAHRETLRRRGAWIARAMFEQVFPQIARGRPGAKLRTAEGDWSPVIDFHPVVIDGAPALRHLHRMSYMAGHELVMGHLLIPTPQGLFEARALAGANSTGYRESTLLAQRPADQPFPAQSEYDDPALDAVFPQHPLSRVRAALDGLRGQWGLKVLNPGPPAPFGELNLPQMGCAFTPPRGFAPLSPATPDSLALRRASFCNTDGLDYLYLRRGPGNPEREALIQRSRSLVESSGLSVSALRLEPLPASGGQSRTQVAMQTTGHNGPERAVVRWFTQPGGELWMLALLGNPAVVPEEELAAELEAVERSWRPLAR